MFSIIFFTWCICICTNFLGFGVAAVLYQDKIKEFFETSDPSDEKIAAILIGLAVSFFLAPLFTFVAGGVALGKWYKKEQAKEDLYKDVV